MDSGSVARMNKRFDLAGRGALVTGAAKGIGRAIALALAESGAKVAAIDADASVHALRDTSDVYTATCNITKEDEVSAAFEGALGALGRIDILVNNAGVNIKAPALEQTRANFAPVVEINLIGTFLCAQAAARIMVEQGRGSIINISSAAGLVALGRGNNFYSATKAAIIGLTRELALEWAPHGIRVNAIAPGWLATDRVATYLSTRPALRSDMESASPMGRIGDPEEVVGPVIFLASDASSLVTGQVLAVDGGLTSAAPLRVKDN
jgi:NAD(P)-dependent dehydrogenase (short-subunit alcohol dehydrogenase family)